MLVEAKKEEHNEILDFVFKSFKLLKNNLLIFFIVPIIFLLGSFMYVTYLKEYKFISQATILPTSDNSGVSGLQSLAQQFGVSMQLDKATKGLTSSIMFPEVLKSRLLAKEVLSKNFTTGKFGEDIKLINIIMDNKDKKDWTQREKTIAIDILRSMYDVQVKRNNPLIVINTLTFEAQLSADLGVAFINVLDSIVNNIVKSQIKEKRLFINARIEEVNDQLIKSEEALKDFRIRNRNISSSPSLLLEQERLIRDEEVKTQVFINLKNQYELARIQEVGGGSMFQVLDFPEAAYRPVGLTRKKTYLYAIVFGFFISAILVFTIDWYKSNNEIIRGLLYHARSNY